MLPRAGCAPTSAPAAGPWCTMTGSEAESLQTLHCHNGERPRGAVIRSRKLRESISLTPDIIFASGRESCPGVQCSLYAGLQAPACICGRVPLAETRPLGYRRRSGIILIGFWPWLRGLERQSYSTTLGLTSWYGLTFVSRFWDCRPIASKQKGG